MIAIAFVDDVRFFGTDEEVKEYKRLVSSKLKVKFEDPPISDFVSIETHQNLDYGITELKMPRYWDKAAHLFKDFVKSGFKDRFNPLSVSDEAILDTPAKHLQNIYLSCKLWESYHIQLRIASLRLDMPSQSLDPIE